MMIPERPEPVELTEEDLANLDQEKLEAYKTATPSPGRGQSAEFMHAIRERRDEMAKLDPTKKGGRPRTKFTKKEATEHALERLEPMALKVLERQLKSPDERVRQAAAVKILEWKRGKPGQSIKVDQDAVTTIRYETVAFRNRTPPKADVELPAELISEDEDAE